ncbi:alkane 1-monooxygenase [Pseudooceanicola sediminis]|uniref:Alkane 1-monooxygenase n=1 Tax=Pseudooceanicola sediminis TaxID=2211117 RepID=A0A399IX58_9RHOB|nr:alkane 1-monooxygenase [Pseudooceanicola sediminis]KAA2313085.1 alkane 1-monooxygenase [Puniceibacterium sp. HSS470]RII37733.1 alkane 1-monooxygenase [Pseudooceanicola sediminis]|tara:strand:- start:17495 stop:18514 length:1020 start_codon:yes stop_codon:yes gene_type:complete
MTGFAIATLGPVPLLLLGMGFGAPWGWLALTAMAVLVPVLDRLLPEAEGDTAAKDGLGTGLSLCLGAVHLGLMALALLWLCGPGGTQGWAVVPAAVALALWFGQVAHPDAHELIHRPGRRSRRLGRLIYATLLFGHHASAHPKVHHRWVASPNDPNTARLGESLWHFLPRAWAGSWRAGARAETRDLRRAQPPRSPWRHPYVGDLVVAIALCALAWGSGGLQGLLVYLGICALVQVQILQADYVQHYGLLREPRGNGKCEPVGPHHAWNTPHAASSAMMLNAPRHSDHHMHPGRNYPALRITPRQMPILPHGLPVMATLALFPRRWRRMMDHRATRWRD